MTKNQLESRSRKYLWILKMMPLVVRKRCPPGIYNVGELVVVVDGNSSVSGDGFNMCLIAVDGGMHFA